MARDFLVTRQGSTVTVHGVVDNGGDAPVSGPLKILLGVQRAGQFRELAVNVPASTTIVPGATFTTPEGLGNIPLGPARFFMLVDADANVTETLESNNDLQLDWAPPVALGSVSEGTTRPGAAVTAVIRKPSLVSLFVADSAGGVYATEGTHAGGWGPWAPASQGRTTPGAPVTAVIRKPSWSRCSSPTPRAASTRPRATTPAAGRRGIGAEGRTTPAPGERGSAQAGLVSLFLADPAGGVYATEGNRADGWARGDRCPRAGRSPAAR